MSNLEKYDKLFLSSFRVKPEDLPTLTYRGIPAWDSVGHMEFMSEMEETFKISLSTLDVLDFSSYEKGKEITGLADVTGSFVFHAGTVQKNGKMLTSGGRVLGVTATAPTLDEAIAAAYADVKKIHFDQMHYRTDIGVKKG